jgi:hypothetical protein
MHSKGHSKLAKEDHLISDDEEGLKPRSKGNLRMSLKAKNDYRFDNNEKNILINNANAQGKFMLNIKF